MLKFPCSLLSLQTDGRARERIFQEHRLQGLQPATVNRVAVRKFLIARIAKHKGRYVVAYPTRAVILKCMTIQLDLEPEVERGLLTQAQVRGLSLEEYVRQIVTRDAQRPPSAALTRAAANLVELSASVRGLLSDEEVNTLFTRHHSPSRFIDLA